MIPTEVAEKGTLVCERCSSWLSLLSLHTASGCIVLPFSEVAQVKVGGKYVSHMVLYLVYNEHADVTCGAKTGCALGSFLDLEGSKPWLSASTG